ncbi:hypothetical protein CUMW_126250 [Citrus unshiu]|nr:hypothetical protein CUMW_126250 [Citrus unshiu]
MSGTSPEKDSSPKQKPQQALKSIPFIVSGGSLSFKQTSERMEKKYTYPPEYSQSQNQQNNVQAGPASANGPSQPGGSNPVQGNPPSRLWRRVSRLFCLCN